MQGDLLCVVLWLMLPLYLVVMIWTLFQIIVLSLMSGLCNKKIVKIERILLLLF